MDGKSRLDHVDSLQAELKNRILYGFSCSFFLTVRQMLAPKIEKRGK